MLTPLRIISSVLFGLILVAGTAWAASSPIQGQVKGPDGKPVQGAHVTIALVDAKGAVASVKTDGQGRYVFKDLAMASYNVNVNADGLAATTATQVKPRTDGALRLDFNLKKQTGAAQGTTPVKKKKATRMVYVPPTTGSNLGGRWIEVDEQGNVDTADVNNVKRGSGAMLGRIQSNSGTARTGN